MENSHLRSVFLNTFLIAFLKSIRDTSELYDLAIPLILTFPRGMKAGLGRSTHT